MARKAAPRFRATADDEPQYAKVMMHLDSPGEGARKRRKAFGKRPKGKAKKKGKVHVVMGEFKRGTLRSGSGAKVRSRKQAIAIAMSEAGLSRRK